MFDALSYSESLISTGVSENTARLQAKGLSEALESNNLATTEDIVRLEANMVVMESKLTGDLVRLESKMDNMESKLTGNIVRLDSKLSGDIVRLESKLGKLDSKMDNMEAKFTTANLEMKVELIKWVAGMSFATMGVMFALLRFMLP